MAEKKKTLAEKAVSIKGKKYVLVADRVLAFNEAYPNGSIKTEMLTPIESQHVFFRAVITPDTAKPERTFNAYSQAIVGDGMVNKTAAWENAETSAVGRALAFMGIGVLEGIASADEINKAKAPVKQYTLNKADDGVQQVGKPCAYCHKTHFGQYDKCRDCWQEEQATGMKKKKLPVKTPAVPALTDDPFEGIKEPSY
ncbi:MAG TPA: hypothetical protein V6D26_00040 [Stenomitos sp.]